MTIARRIEEAELPLLFDFDRMQPGCVLLQAVAGGCGATLRRLFGAEGWLTNPTPGLRLYRATFEQWRRVADIARLEAELEKS
jgi:hypothetical protein